MYEITEFHFCLRSSIVASDVQNFSDCRESSLNPVTAISAVPFADGDIQGED